MLVVTLERICTCTEVSLSIHHYIIIHICTNYLLMVWLSVFDKLIWGTIGPKSFLFGIAQFSLWASGAINYDCIVTNSINSWLIGSRCILNGTHTNHFEPIWSKLQNLSKTLVWPYLVL